jgi:YidC/Oxa1 family membrane protein insertase
METDKRTIIGFTLIGIILTAWFVWQSSVSRRPIPAQENTSKTAATSPVIRQTSPSAEQKLGKQFAPFAARGEHFITVETDLYTALISSRGGTIARWELKKYNSWFNEPAQLIPQYGREVSVSFYSAEGKKISDKDLNFSLTTTGQSSGSSRFRIAGRNTLTLTATLDLGRGSRIVKHLKFRGNEYIFDADVTLDNMSEYIPTRRFDMNWTRGLQFQEHNSVDESNISVAMASLAGTKEEMDATDFAVPAAVQHTGTIDFAAIRSKYFVAAIKQKQPHPEATLFLEGQKIGAPDNGHTEQYSMSYRLPFSDGKPTTGFEVYLGPQEYETLEKYELGSTIDFGWRLIIAPLGEYFMLPIFTFIHKFIPNYGISIIIFSILMKILLYPLSIGQLRTAKYMSLLAPEVNKVREKYKDDQMTQQQEVMKIYSEYGINPMGGCLPMLLQMPIMYALWAVLNSIQLRQAHFFGWITDLSVPDVILDLGFKIPLFEIDKFSGLALIMGATLFIQQKMTITDPRQKSMVYMMPIMFTLMFSSFAAGLNLYYLVFNLLGIGQQLYMTKFSKNTMTLAELKRMPKKEGWLQKRLRMAQEIAASQGKTLPGQPPQRSNGMAVKQRPPKKK